MGIVQIDDFGARRFSEASAAARTFLPDSPLNEGCSPTFVATMIRERFFRDPSSGRSSSGFPAGVTATHDEYVSAVSTKLPPAAA